MMRLGRIGWLNKIYRCVITAAKAKYARQKEVVIKPIYWTVSESAEESGDSTEET